MSLHYHSLTISPWAVLTIAHSEWLAATHYTNSPWVAKLLTTAQLMGKPAGAATTTTTARSELPTTNLRPTGPTQATQAATKYSPSLSKISAAGSTLIMSQLSTRWTLPERSRHYAASSKHISTIHTDLCQATKPPQDIDSGVFLCRPDPPEGDRTPRYTRRYCDEPVQEAPPQTSSRRLTSSLKAAMRTKIGRGATLLPEGRRAH